MDVCVKHGLVRLLVVVYLICPFMHATAQSTDIIFNHISVEEGLSQSSVFAITQDAEGFMWFGTRDGLNRYDGRRLVVYESTTSSSSSLSDNTIYGLLTDSRGRLWAGGRIGLNLYDSERDQFKRFYSIEGNARSLSSNAITCMIEDSQHRIWVGTRRGLNLMVERDSVQFIQFVRGEKNSLVNDEIRSVFEDSAGRIWIGTSEGFSRLDYKSETDFTFTFFEVPSIDKETARGNWVNAFAEDGNGNLLVGTERNGLQLFDTKQGKFIATSWTSGINKESHTVRSILRDTQGKLWIGTIGGLFILDQKTGQTRRYSNIPDNRYSISDNSVRSIFIDRDKTIWIGTFHGGVNSYSPLAKQFQHFEPGMDWPNLNFKVASAMVSDRHGNLWLSTEGNGLLYVDRKNKTTRYFKHRTDDKSSLSHNNIKCLLLDEDKGLWVGTIKGLDYLDFRTQRFNHYTLGVRHDRVIQDGAVYSLLRDDDGNFWVGTYRGGLMRFNVRENRFDEAFTSDPANPQAISSGGITYLFLDSKRDMWVGTVVGLNKKARGEKTFTKFLPDSTRAGALLGGYIICIYEDSKHRLWIGTRGQGLNLLQPDGKSFKIFTTDNGLPDNSINGILEDRSGNLWLSTENGLAKFNPELGTCRTFNTNDGLVCKEFNFNSFHRDATGRMYFGGYNGVVHFHPDSIQENRVVPALAFTRLKLFNREVKLHDQPDAVLQSRLNHTREIELNHDQNVFSVEFAVLNFINAQKNQFAYKLSGFEDQWNAVDEPQATYMNLKPGRYTLLIKGANNDGVWNEKPLALSIHVLPPPWKTWWAYVIYVSIFGCLLYLWSRLNKKQVELKHELEIEHLEKQKQEELHQAKLNFFTNIAHEIRTPLTLMVGPVDQLADRLDHDSPLKKEIGLVKSNSDRLMRLLNQLLDFHKQETGNVRLKVRKENFIEFIHDTLLPFQDFARTRKISISITTRETAIPLWFDRDELSKVFYNLLVNAFKFTPGGGGVNVDIARVDTGHDAFNVKVTLEDNGLGIPTAQLEKIFHRFYQAENTGMQEAGFGIGLALAKGIIDLHHGEIHVESKEATNNEQGFTRFTILLRGGHAHFEDAQIMEHTEPHENVQAQVIRSPLDATLHPTGAESQVSNTERHLVLVVEDNDEIRDYLHDILKDHYDVQLAKNGQEGWEIAAENLPDLVVSDVMMPVMNGLELVAKLKTDQRTSHIPVILLTARGTVNHQVEGLETGADDYLPKPFNVQLLQVKIKNHLALREKLREKYSRIVTLQPSHEEVEDPDDKFLQRLMRILEDNIVDSDFNVSKLVREIGMSRPVLFRKTKMLTGLSVIDLIRNVRLKKAEMLLRQKKLSISEVAFTVGFSDPKYFSKTFRNHFGKTPTQYLEELGET